jgi:oligopeptidase A
MTVLYDFKEFVPFGKLTTSDIEDALNKALDNAIDSLDNIENLEQVSWQELQQSLYLALYKLSQIWVIANHLQSVNDTSELRELQQKYQSKISEFYVRLGQSKKLYQHLNHIKIHEWEQLNQEDKKIIENEFRDFRLSGIELNPNQQEQFKTIQKRLAELSTKFEQNLLDSTDSYSKLVTLAELKGIPEDLLAQYKADTPDNLYKITLHIPSYLPIMEYCENRELRKELHYQYATRASELHNSKWDNSQNICEILKLRQQKAHLLGFKDYTELSLFTKMADSADEVLNFLYQLADKSKHQAYQDLDELKTFAKTNCGIDNLEVWDIAFVSDKLQQYKYSYSNWELKQYFPLNRVLDGLFNLIHELYQVDLKLNKNIPLWNKDMLAYDIIKENTNIGTLYMDLFARTGKQSGAWMNSLQDKFALINNKPHAGIMCNFTPPTKDRVALLTFDEVQTLFHEMGHSLHHLLTNINHFSIAGINGVEWDAVELPSQFMEYFAWDRQILRNISSHVKTGESISDELYQKLIKARYYQSGLTILRQIEFAVLDILLHQNNIVTPDDYINLTTDVRNKVAVIVQPQYNRFLNSFSHIFAGGYASGYYSYKWAEVLATDIFSKFEAEKCYTSLGNKFYTTILSQGGLKPMLENFVAFMGREPKIDALLKYSGIN